MPKKAIVDLVSGQQGWDARVNDNNAVLRDGPIPVVSAVSEVALEASHPAADNLEGVAVVNTGAAIGLYVSDGTSWVKIGGTT